MRKLVVLGLVGLVAVGLWARQTPNTYDTTQAVNQVLPINYTSRLSFTPSMNSRIMPPAAAGNSEIWSNKLAIDGFNQIRVDDWSTMVNASCNVTARFYSPVTYLQEKRLSGATMNVYVTDIVQMITANIPLGETYYVSRNLYSLVDFEVKTMVANSTSTVTLNLTIRNTDKTLGETITHDSVALTDGVRVKLNYNNYRVVKLTNNHATVGIFLGGVGVTNLSYGDTISAAQGKSLSFNDSGYTGYVVSNGTVTLNVLLLK